LVGDMNMSSEITEQDIRDQKLLDQFERVLNGANRENVSNTPDWVLAAFLLDALRSFETASKRRDAFNGRSRMPGEEVLSCNVAFIPT
jgi:hypothetical protein